jgi:hypothetical protein
MSTEVTRDNFASVLPVFEAAAQNAAYFSSKWRVDLG